MVDKPLCKNCFSGTLQSKSTVANVGGYLSSLLLGDLPKAPDHGSGHSAPGFPDGAAVGPEGCRGPFQPQLFHDPVVVMKLLK